jgi:hypothetical protein
MPLRQAVLILFFFGPAEPLAQTEQATPVATQRLSFSKLIASDRRLYLRNIRASDMNFSSSGADTVVAMPPCVAVEIYRENLFGPRE